jgi:hypothetical protein
VRLAPEGVHPGPESRGFMDCALPNPAYAYKRAGHREEV